MSSARAEGGPITREQAISCLSISPGNQVHSFWLSVFLAGADLTLTRVKEMVNSAAAAGQLF